jgi:hypothetical protein
VVFKEKETKKEWQTILWSFTIGGGIFGGMYMFLQDIKKSAHARISRLENVVDEIVRDDRFETNINNRLDGMATQQATTNSRIDDLTKILLNKNGVHK